MCVATFFWTNRHLRVGASSPLRQPLSGAKVGGVSERETPLLIPKEMKLIKQIVSTTASPPSSGMDGDGGSSPRARWKRRSQMRQLPLSLLQIPGARLSSISELAVKYITFTGDLGRISQTLESAVA